MAIWLVSVGAWLRADIGLGLGWEGGLAEAVAFVHRMEKSDPTASARVVLLEEPVKGRVKSAVAVYRVGDECRLYAGPLEALAIPGLSAADFPDDGKVRAAVAGLVPKLQSGWKPEQPNADAGIALAASRLAEDASLADLPMDRAVLSATKARPDGTREKVEVPQLIFYWNGYHVAYRPGSSCSLLKVPVDETLGFTHACVRHGDLIDALLYAAALEKQKPGALRQVAFAGWRANRVSCGGAAAISVEDGKTWVFNTFLGRLEFASLPVGEAGDPLMGPAQVWIVLCRAWQRQANDESPDNDFVGPDTLREKLKAFPPQGLPGDTDHLQLKRAQVLLTRAGVKATLAVREKRLRFTYRDIEYVFEPDTGGAVFPGEMGRRTPEARQRFLADASVLGTYRRFKEGRDALRLEVGESLLEGISLPADFELGRAILREAALQGDNTAKFILSRHLADYSRTKEEENEATALMRDAAMAGFPEAVFNYGARLASGRGASDDLVEGLAWMLAAPRLPGADIGIAQVKKELADSPDKIELAMKRSLVIQAELEKATKGASAAPTPTPR
ncbi:tetratricopeptide repeat protein [Nibricoccus sp. IMCC34717]|uniref:tetratricopeptide repeat protein n=1 Tax=Nibricoccus sp. IMCC34717 TaxID=3034021 RepID=UPI00384A4686